MNPRRLIPWRRMQSGFSMVEMLMAAFILAIGILGLSMLQVMSLHASRGSHSLTNAIELADRVMDQIELEGRLSWLNITDSNIQPPVALTTLQYIGQGVQYMGFNESGQPATLAPVAAKPAPATSPYVMTVTEGVAMAAAAGATSDYVVTVEFSDTADTGGNRIVRNVSIARRILHG